MTEADTAAALGSGDVPVLGTPRVVAWCEEATVVSLADNLGPGETAVGMRVRLDHVRATRVGACVSVRAELTKVEGRRLTFDVVATDDRGEVASGQVVRVVVDRQRFLDRAAKS